MPTNRLSGILSTPSEVPEGLWLHVLLPWGTSVGQNGGALDYIFQCMLEYPGTTCLVVRRTVTELETAVWKDVVRFIKTYEIPTQKESIGDGIIVWANGSSFSCLSPTSPLCLGRSRILLALWAAQHSRWPWSTRWT